MNSSSLSIRWKDSVADYKRLNAIRFGSQDELETAMDILAREDDVSSAPFRPVGQETIFVPYEATSLMTAHFERCRLDFIVRPVYRQNDLAPEQIRRAQSRRTLNY